MNWFLSDFNIRAWRFMKHYEFETAPSMTLVYGPPGVGKSSLLNFLNQQRKKEGSILIDSPSFSRQYAFAAQENNLPRFRQYYRAASLLLLDDLQCLAGKKQTIEEILFTYENIVQRGGKMVAILETDVLNLNYLGDRLTSRLLGGIVIPINKPQGYELEGFVEEYSHRLLLSMDLAIPEMIAQRTESLTGAQKILHGFLKYAELHNDELSKQCFLSYWQEEVRKQSQEISPMNILQAASQVMGFTLEEIVGSTQKPSVNEARQLAIYAVRTLCNLSYPAIASYFNRRHSTIITAYKKMEEKLFQNQELLNRYQEIKNKFKDITKE
ncbi:chromosomal replication initiator protein DnaA [Desulfosporosinus acididurans]|uniref:Chromosomal replication initiator protein DnaA n=1 Tax=Desulfosporosinus acididurans TaxID=476652 RepID=A0A0J1ITB4_9FIRM|nr:DnaA/Hda family protein [Desulfosporosinus acididurans]KLU67886.1 chromosomal replication initiator protein DnaA [Desulfosporosinus acididurans]